MKNILVTGGAGFIGSHYVRFLLQQDSEIHVLNADALTYSANLQSLADVASSPRYQFARVNLAKEEEVKELFAQTPFHEVVHFAAESHVDRSIQGAKPFIDANLIGTYHLLEAVRHSKSVKKMVHVSTDEVYGSIQVGKTLEGAALQPGNPYSASKASSDLFCHAYVNTYQLPISLTRCTNNYGPCQHPEKLIPKMILAALKDEPLSVYGKGQQERDWLFVTDHCRAVDRVRQEGGVGEVYHIGAERPLKNIEVINRIVDHLNKPRSLIHYVGDRLGHDFRYSLDTQKIQSTLGWTPRISFEEGLERTIDWYKRYYATWKKGYIRSQKGNGRA